MLAIRKVTFKSSYGVWWGDTHMECSAKFPQCKHEFNINSPQMNQAFRVAEIFSMDTPIEKRTVQIPSGYPYVWRSLPEHNTIRLDMGHDESGKKIMAVFTLRANVGKPGVVVHVVVWLINEQLARERGIEPEYVAVFSANTRYHTEAEKHFLGQLLRLDLHLKFGSNEAYLLTVTDVPPPPDEEPLPAPPDVDTL